MEVDEIRDMYGKCPMAEIHDAYRSIDIENVDPYSSNDTPLHLACTYADYEAIKILLERGADYNAVNNYAETPLHLLAKQDTNHYPTSDGQTRGCANILLSAKVSATPKNDVGRTPIMEAASCDIFAELVKIQGIEINAQDDEGTTALMKAALNRNPSYTQMLLDAGAKVNMENNEGQTALGFAVFANHVDVTRLLIAHGANVNATDEKGRTTLDYATYRLKTSDNDEQTAEVQEIINMLIKAGAKNGKS